MKSAYYTDYLLDEAVSPDIYIKTGMADYVPNMFNLFVDENGYRMDPAYIKGTGFWPTTKRAGMNLIQGGAGLLLVGFVGVFIIKRFGVGIREAGVGAIDTAGGVVAEVGDEVGDLALTAKIQYRNSDQQAVQRLGEYVCKPMLIFGLRVKLA